MFGMWLRGRPPEPLPAHPVADAMLAGAAVAVEGQRQALLTASAALTRAAYALRDDAGLGHEAGLAMDAAYAAEQAAGGSPTGEDR